VTGTVGDNRDRDFEGASKEAPTDTLGRWRERLPRSIGSRPLGSDLPIETLRSGFEGLYAAYDAVIESSSDDDRRPLFRAP
jgi:predicted TIM-barrel fold metal-dependent hydrolase